MPDPVFPERFPHEEHVSAVIFGKQDLEYSHSASPPQGREQRGKVALAARHPFSPHAPPIPFHNALAYGEAEPGAGVFIGMQPLEQTEDALRMLLLEADPVIPHGDNPLPRIPLSGDINLREPFAAAVFQGVRQEILEHVSELLRVATNGRQ